MAIFQTGAVTTVPNLLDIIAAFAVANGFTQNYNAVEGSGRRVHLQLSSDVFINLRALVNESINNGTVNLANNVNGLVMSGSTGYSGAASWLMQAGKPYYDFLNGNGHVPKLVGMMGISGAMPAYYLFARGSMIYCWLEYATGQYQWLMFGRITKTSTWSGGAMFAAANNGYSNTINNYAGIANLSVGSHDNAGNAANGYLYGAAIDGNTGWLSCINESITPAMPKFFDMIANIGAGVGNLANTFNTQPVILPVDIAITRDGTGNRDANTNFSVEGILPDLYFCNLRYLIPAQQIDDGSGDTFRVFPFRQKATFGLGSTGWWGVAIKEN